MLGMRRVGRGSPVAEMRSRPAKEPAASISKVTFVSLDQ